MILKKTYKKLGRVFKMSYRTQRLLYVYTREDLKDGVTQVRYRTDLVYLWIFLSFMFLLVILCTRYYIDGNVRKLFNGIDSFGNTCGTKNRKHFNHPFSGLDHTNRSYMMYLSYQTNVTEVSLCVRSCASSDGLNMERFAYKDMNVEAICYHIGIKCPTSQKSDAPFWNRCHPEGITVKEIFCNKNIFKYNTLDVTFGISNMGFIIIYGFAITLLGMWLLFHFPHLFIIFSFISLSFACGVIATYCWIQFFASDVRNLNFLKIMDCPICFDLMLAIAFTILLIRLVWDFNNNYVRMKKEVTLIKLCSGVVKNVPAIYFTPFLIIMLEIFVIGLVIFMYFFMRSCYIPVQHNGSLIHQEPPSFIKQTSWLFYVMSYWVLSFLLNCGFYLASDVVCRWYFDPDVYRLDRLSPAIGSLIVFHLGSAVKGTAMFCFVNKLLCSIFSPYYWKIKTEQLDRKVSFGHLFHFYDQYLKYINSITYMSMAMFGFDLQISSQISFVTILSDFYIRNHHRMKHISKSISRFKYSNLVIVFWMLRNFADNAETELCSKSLPVIVSFTIAYFIIGDLCDLVIQIYHTLFVCICIDYSCNITSDENDFTRNHIVKYYLYNTDKQEME